MPITLADVEAELAREPVEAPGGYTDRDSLLYAVAVGMGRDPMDRKELEYVCETQGDRVLPSAATVLSRAKRVEGAGPGLGAKMNFALLLHGEQRTRRRRLSRRRSGPHSSRRANPKQPHGNPTATPHLGHPGGRYLVVVVVVVVAPSCRILF